MSGEAQPKQLKDFSDEVKQKIPEYTAHITDKSTESQVNEAIAQLLNLEKKTRLAADARSTSEVSLAILRVCVTTKSWRTLNDHITLLSKRRAQLQKVQENIITYGATIVQQQQDATIKRQLIETLRTVSDGKMFAELDRARLTKSLAVMEENDGKINEAAELLQEVQVETIGSMETREKAEFLCEQVRLCLAKRDYVRAEIIAKKVDEKLLNEEQYQDLKVRYYKLKIQYHTHYGNYLEIFKAWRHIYNTTSVQADPTQWQPALRRVIMYLILSPFDAEVSDAVQRTLLLDKKVAQLPAFKSVLDAFTTDEVMAWPLPSESEWKADETFAGASADVEMKDANDKAEPAGATAKDRWADLHKRVVQHNIRVIAKYYARITSQRLGALLGLDVAKSETFLSEMVSSKQLFAKIDRPTGIITFAATLSPSALVNAWSDDIVALLNLVEKTCHSINKENMVYKVGQTSSA